MSPKEEGVGTCGDSREGATGFREWIPLGLILPSWVLVHPQLPGLRHPGESSSQQPQLEGSGKQQYTNF